MYWVRGEVDRIGSDWCIAEWRDERWSLPGDDNAYFDDDFTDFGPRIPPPDEPPTLLAALDGREAGWNEAIEAAAKVAEEIHVHPAERLQTLASHIRKLAR